jgi:hypothetical protein
MVFFLPKGQVQEELVVKRSIMKNIQHISSSQTSHSKDSSARHYRAAKPKQATGSVADRYPVVLDGGKTIIYITDKSKESEIRSRYEARVKSEPAVPAELL